MSYPLRFHRIAVPKPWAGSRLSALFPGWGGLPAGTGETIELADLPGQTSLIANGEWRDNTIRAVVPPNAEPPDFPLAVKFLDTAQPLSIQDHPSDQRENGRLVRRGKSECWLVLAADEGAVIYQGLREGVTPQQFERALADGDPAELLNARAMKPGDYLYNEAGMLHAIGGGLALLEIQQNCPTTYRLWDFPRDEKREMHLADGLAAAKFELQLPPIQQTDGEDKLLQADGPFGVRSLRVKKARPLNKDWLGFTLVTCLQGRCEFTGRARDNLQPAILHAGDTVLFPAEFDDFEIYPEAEAWLTIAWARE